MGTEGFVDAGGTIHLLTDGDSYTVAAEDGTAFTLSVDEQNPSAPLAGELVVAEFHRDPNGTNIPGNRDRAYNITSAFLGWSGIVPPLESITVFTSIPNNANLHNLIIYGVFYTYDNAGSIVVRKVSLPEFMIIT